VPIPPASRSARGPFRLPLVAVLALTVAFLCSVGVQPPLGASADGTAASLVSMDGRDLSILPATRSVGQSDAERNQASDQLLPLLVLVALALALAHRGWVGASPLGLWRLRPAVDDPRGARAPPVHV
jgi:hypothetical protein